MVGGAALAAGAAAASCLPDVDGRWPPDGGQALCSWTEPKITPGFPAEAGRVVSIGNPNLVTPPPQVRIVDKQVEPTLTKLLKTLTSTDTVSEAWRKILPGYVAGEVVGIKVNTLNAKVPTHPELVYGLVQLLTPLVGARNIVVWDRRLDELQKAGFDESYLGCRVVGTQDDPQSQGNGPGYETDGICVGSQRARLSRLITRSGKEGGIDHLINFAVLKNHLASGFTGVLKNHYGTFHNPGSFHDDVEMASGQVKERRFEQAIPTINALPEVAKKARLWLMDASIVVIKGDTDSAPDWTPSFVAGSLDPVALDAYGRQVRDESVVKSGAPRPTEAISTGYLQACERVGLGSATVKIVDGEPIL